MPGWRNRCHNQKKKNQQTQISKTKQNLKTVNLATQVSYTCRGCSYALCSITWSCCLIIRSSQNMFQGCPGVFAAESFPPLIQVALIAYPWMILELGGPRYESVLSCKPRFDWCVLMIIFHQPALGVSQYVFVSFLPKFYSSKKCHVYPVLFFLVMK